MSKTPRRLSRIARGVRAVACAAVVLVAAACATAPAPTTNEAGVTVRGGGKASPYRGVTLDAAYDKPTTTFTDTSGKPFDIAAQTADKITLLFFGYTHCPDVCPLTMSDLSVALDKVPDKVRSQVEVVFVTTDPDRDTPSVIRTWLDKFDASFVGLTGPFADISAAAKALGVPIMAPSAGPNGSYDVDHGTQVFAYGKDGKARLLWLGGTTTDDYAHDIERLAKAS